MCDGREFSRRKNILPDDGESGAEVLRKFRDNTREVLTPERAASLADKVLNMVSAGSVRAFARLDWRW